MNKKTDPLVVAVVVNWNGLEDTVKCVESLRKLKYSNCNIVVIDNASKVNEARILRDTYGNQIHVLRNKENRGYAAGLNRGIRFALRRFKNVKYFLLSNNDIVFDPYFLKSIMRVMEKHPRIGITAGMTLFMDRTVYSMGWKWNLKTGIVTGIVKATKDSMTRRKTKIIDFVSGSAFIARIEVVRKIGLMDEEYFLYYEETDYCLRARRAGWEIALVPTAVAFHKSEASIKKTSLESILYYYQRSRIRFIIKNIESIYMPLAMLINMTIVLEKSCISSLKRKNPLIFYRSSKAVLENLLNLRHIRRLDPRIQVPT